MANNIDPKSPEAISLATGLIGGVAILGFFVVLTYFLGMHSGLYPVHGMP